MNKFNFFLELLIISSILCSLIVITSTNPVIAIIYTIVVFLNAAIYLILIGLGFIGISYIIVYIGAITVLFLFVIMMINTDILDIVEIGPNYGKNLPLAYTVSILFFISFFILIPTFIGSSGAIYNFELFKYINDLILNPSNTPLLNGVIELPSTINFNSSNLLHPEFSISNVLQIEILGQYLYTHGGILLLLSSIILLLALVAPIILSKQTNLNS